MKAQVRGIVLIVIGLALIFPLFSRFVLENLIVLLGVYLIYVGYCTIASGVETRKRIDKKLE